VTATLAIKDAITGTTVITSGPNNWVLRLDGAGYPLTQTVAVAWVYTDTLGTYQEAPLVCYSSNANGRFTTYVRIPSDNTGAFDYHQIVARGGIGASQNSARSPLEVRAKYLLTSRVAGRLLTARIEYSRLYPLGRIYSWLVR
jgi:hypothetical protein